MLRLGKSCHIWNLVVFYITFKFDSVLNYIFLKIGVHDFRAYDRAAIKFRGVDADINFNLSDYEDDMKQVG